MQLKMRNLGVTIYSVCITYHLSQLMPHDCSSEISGTFKMVFNKWKTLSKVSFHNAAAAFAASPQDMPDPEAVTPPV